MLKWHKGYLYCAVAFKTFKKITDRFRSADYVALNLIPQININHLIDSEKEVEVVRKSFCKKKDNCLVAIFLLLQRSVDIIKASVF